jgi:hypothetical protein
MPEFQVRCRGPLAQETIDELRTRGVYVTTAGEGPEPRLHRLIVEVESEEEAVPRAERLVEAAGGSRTFELEGPAAGA